MLDLCSGLLFINIVQCKRTETVKFNLEELKMKTINPTNLRKQVFKLEGYYTLTHKKKEIYYLIPFGEINPITIRNMDYEYECRAATKKLLVTRAVTPS